MASDVEAWGTIGAILLAAALPYLLVLIALWRMGTGLKSLAEAGHRLAATLEGPEGQSSIREIHGDAVDVLAQISQHGMGSGKPRNDAVDK